MDFNIFIFICKCFFGNILLYSIFPLQFTALRAAGEYMGLNANKGRRNHPILIRVKERFWNDM